MLVEDTWGRVRPRMWMVGEEKWEYPACEGSLELYVGGGESVTGVVVLARSAQKIKICCCSQAFDRAYRTSFFDKSH